MRTNTARVRIAERFLREILVLVRRFREVFLARKVRYGYIYIASIIAAASYSVGISGEFSTSLKCFIMGING